MLTLVDGLRKKALTIGFDAFGIAPALPSSRGDAFRAWLAAGRHAGMAWIGRDPERRLDPARVLPGTRSIVSVGLSYHLLEPPPDLWNDPLRGRVARYAWGNDYHDVMLPMLEELAAWLMAEAGPEVVHRAYVDTGPLLEREIAERAGLGFVGRHSLVISPTHGSYLLLGELLLTLDLPPTTPPAPRGTCGNCSRCQQACPTHAFPAPYIVDSNRCLSWLTIENKGDIPEPLRPALRNWIFGCDECQTVCPWVRQFSRPGQTRFLNFTPDRCAPRLEDLLALDDAGFKARFAGTPLLRPKRRGLLRNACVALGNSANRAAMPALERAAADPEPLIATHAAWALDRLAQNRSAPLPVAPGENR